MRLTRSRALGGRARRQRFPGSLRVPPHNAVTPGELTDRPVSLESLLGLLPLVYEFVGGGALAVGILGVTRSGSDVVLGAILICLSLPLTLKGRITSSRLAEEAMVEVQEQLGQDVTAQVEQILRRRGVLRPAASARRFAGR